MDTDELARKKISDIEQELAQFKSHQLTVIESWISILKQIITAADMYSMKNVNDSPKENKKIQEANIVDACIFADHVDDNEQFNANESLSEQFSTNSVKWTLRVKAFKLVRQLLQRTEITSQSTRIILKHLPDLVRISFVAATSPYDNLKLEGYEMFVYLIEKFAHVEEKEFPGRSVIEQYRTQVMTAAKPAFELDAPPYITAIAVQVTSAWIRWSVDRNLIDFKRTYSLLLGSITKLKSQSTNQNIKLYNESEIEQERLSILGSWADVFVYSCNNTKTTSLIYSKELKSMVELDVKSITKCWWEALKDYSLLIGSASKTLNNCHDNQSVYTREIALSLFKPVWHKIVYAVTIWIARDSDNQLDSENQESISEKIDKETQATDRNDSLDSKLKQKYVKFLCCIIMKELFTTKQKIQTISQGDQINESVSSVLKSLDFICNDLKLKYILKCDILIIQEFICVLSSMLKSPTLDQNSNTYKQVLKTTDIMLSTLIEEKVFNSEQIQLGISVLVRSIHKSFKELNNEDESLIPSYSRKLLSTKLKCLIALIRTYPEFIVKEDDVRDSQIMVMLECVEFKKDLSIFVEMIEHLDQLYPALPENISSIYIDGMLETQVRFIMDLIQDITSKSPCKHDSSHLAIVIKYLSLFRKIISMSTMEKRQKMLEMFLKLLLCFKPGHDISSSQLLASQKNLIELGIKQIKEITVAYPGDIKAVFDTDMKRSLSEMLRLQKDWQKAEIEESQRESNELHKKALELQQQQAANKSSKIVLKMDFSNFYDAKKDNDKLQQKSGL